VVQGRIDTGNRKAKNLNLAS
jgi:hypothetical protein